MRIRQIAFIAHDLDKSREQLATLLQMDPPYRDPGVAVFGLDNAVFVFGDQFIEIVAPVQPDTAGGRHLARQGDSGYMLLLQTDRLDADRERLDRLGVRRVRNSDHADMSASHLHPKDVGGTIVSIDEPRPAASWRWGGPDWRLPDGDRARQRIRGLTLRAQDPAAMARRWAEVFACADPLRHGDRWRLSFDDGFADFTQGAGEPEGIVGFTLAVTDPAAVIARGRAMGLTTGDASVRLLGATLSFEQA